jgi:hypothetical protein
MTRPAYLNPNNEDARKDAWSNVEIYWASYQNLLNQQLRTNIDFL